MPQEPRPVPTDQRRPDPPPAPPRRGRIEREAHAYLSRLLTHYAPDCEPLPDLLGLCSQIDNLLTGMVHVERHWCSGCGNCGGADYRVVVFCADCGESEKVDPNAPSKEDALLALVARWKEYSRNSETRMDEARPINGPEWESRRAESCTLNVCISELEATLTGLLR